MAIVVGALFLDPTTGRAKFGDVTAELTRMESALLSFLIDASPKLCSCEELLQQVWDYTPYTGSPSLVRTHMYQIRKKLGAESILTKVGWGYYVE